MMTMRPKYRSLTLSYYYYSSQRSVTIPIVVFTAIVCAAIGLINGCIRIKKKEAESWARQGKRPRKRDVLKHREREREREKESVYIDSLTRTQKIKHTNYKDNSRNTLKKTDN